jgi:hypothetical protein
MRTCALRMEIHRQIAGLHKQNSIIWTASDSWHLSHVASENVKWNELTQHKRNRGFLFQLTFTLASQ